MVDIRIEGGRVVFEVEGWDKMWALKSRLEIPIEHVRGARVDDDAARAVPGGRWLMASGGS